MTSYEKLQRRIVELIDGIPHDADRYTELVELFDLATAAIREARDAVAGELTEGLEGLER